MPSVRPYGGIYNRFGDAPRNQPVFIPPVNPLEANAMALDTGNAGCDGYTVLSRANRHSGQRPMIDGTPQFEGPYMSEDPNNGF
jgi:hypothetical protein